MKTVNCIMLIDDNPDDNFFHERVIRKNNAANTVIAMESAMDALNYLKSRGPKNFINPDLIFLDINMPGMNGWDFLDAYTDLDKSLKKQVVVVMLTTSENPDDVIRAKAMGVVTNFKTKPLTREMLEEIIHAYF